MDRDGILSFATRYELDGTGIESRWGRTFLHLSWRALGPTPKAKAYLNYT